MFVNDENKKIEPDVEVDGQYCFCTQCGYYKLLPVQHTHCPKCKIELDWDWLETMKISK